ncbi:MAG TPA: sigma-70 family RNA polymerase sigma factor [Conexibacter sp.]|nr:sigma-70 family RNA polymerase sigma factor [Conexibacter sp.]
MLAAQRGDPHARADLIERFTPLIGSVAGDYRRSNGVERSELMQEGVAGLLTALRRFEPTRGTPFWAYATWWVRQAMQQLVAATTRPVVLSDRALRQLARVRDARSAHARVHHAWPSTTQLATATGLPVRQVQQLIVAERAPGTLAESRGDDAASGRPHARHRVGTVLADPHAEDAYDRVLMRLECDDLGVLLSGLQARERVVLRAHFGLDGPEQSLRTIGRHLGLSAERVRQIEQHALEQLRVAAGVP